MTQKLLTLYKLDGRYILSDNVPNGAEVLACYNNLNEILQYSTAEVGTSSFTSPSVISYSRTLSDEGRVRISEASSKAQKGSGNSQFGTRWIHSLKKKKSKKIRATDPLPDGWNEGRKIKFKD